MDTTTPPCGVSRPRLSRSDAGRWQVEKRVALLRTGASKESPTAEISHVRATARGAVVLALVLPALARCHQAADAVGGGQQYRPGLGVVAFEDLEQAPVTGQRDRGRLLVIGVGEFCQNVAPSAADRGRDSRPGKGEGCDRRSCCECESRHLSILLSLALPSTPVLHGGLCLLPLPAGSSRQVPKNLGAGGT